MTHTIDERFISWLWVNLNLWFVGEVVLGVLIGESEVCLFVQLPFKGNVEIDYLSLQNIGQRLRVRNYALYQIWIKRQLHFANNRWQWVSKELNNLFRRILRVINKHMMTLPLLGTTNYQLLASPVSNANGVNSWVFIIHPHHLNDTLCVRNSPIS